MKQKKKIIELFPDEENSLRLLKKAGTTTMAVMQAGTPIGFVSATIGVYKQIGEALKEEKLAKEERIAIEAACSESVEMLEEYRIELSNVVSEYMEQHLVVFNCAMDDIEKAVESDDVDLFIKGNNAIQNRLGHDTAFENIDDFDEIMLGDGDFKL